MRKLWDVDCEGIYMQTLQQERKRTNQPRVSIKSTDTGQLRQGKMELCSRAGPGNYERKVIWQTYQKDKAADDAEDSIRRLIDNCM